MTITPIVFPDVELALTAYLRTQLAAHGYPGMYVSNRYDGRGVAVWVRRDGGSDLDQVRELARVGVNVFTAASTDQPVTDLARTVSALLRAIPGTGPFLRARQSSGPSAIPDTHPRRFMTFEFTVKGVEL